MKMEIKMKITLMKIMFKLNEQKNMKRNNLYFENNVRKLIYFFNKLFLLLN